MTGISPTADFFARLRKIDKSGLMPRDTMVLWAIARENGTMGLEIARKLGFPSRSYIQTGLRRLIDLGYIEDRRPKNSLPQKTPNELYVLPAGEAFLADIVPL